ncbi:alpha/beta fold hydrolase [Tessaracoccus sp. OS52]|uniref:alpha/beta fold hydrolase n=1 Tax=Tessaracoccus sp. OS52 TaxID=2886691 RepID=UPI001D130234|nr:alpha/beta fold hydrolase [Tessaracoccus sp. OS52]MCC2593486.1 alpha/beta fold hydrolase [Tessaracoccus sp. OS52]
MKLTFDTYNPNDPAKRVLVLGPSLGGNAQHQWTAVAERLRSEARVVFVDLPGHALTPVWDDADEPTLDTVAEAVMEVVREVSETNDGLPVFYAGLSISGAVGLHLARDHEEELAGVAVACSAATVGEPTAWRKRAEAVEERGTQHLVDETRKRWFTPDFQARQPHTVDTIMEGLAVTDDHSYAQLCRALAVHDVRGDLENIRTPLLLIAGERDSSTPIGNVELVASTVPGAELRIIPEAAHQVTVAEPREVAAALAAFMNRVERPRKPYLED